MSKRRRIPRGKPLTELVKGSLDYTRHAIERAFYRQFPYDDDIWCEEIFADYIIVYSSDLEMGEYYRVTYMRQDGKYVFAERDNWEVVELAYQPAQPGITERRRVLFNFVEDGVRYELRRTRCADPACQECQQHIYGHGPYWFAEIQHQVSYRLGGSDVHKQQIFLGETWQAV